MLNYFDKFNLHNWYYISFVYLCPIYFNLLFKMAYFNYFKFLLHLRVLLSSDFVLVSISRLDDVMLIVFDTNYYELRDKLMSCLDTLVEFELLTFVSQEVNGSRCSLRYSWNFELYPF